MKFGSLKKIVGGIAPVLGATLGGPLGATAGKVIAEVLGCEPTPEAIDARMREATTEDLVRIKEAELKYAAKMKELGVDMYELETKDKQDARSHFAGDWTARSLAITLVVGFLAYVAMITMADPEDNPMEIINLILGWLGAQVSAVVSYYFGASQPVNNKE